MRKVRWLATASVLALSLSPALAQNGAEVSNEIDSAEQTGSIKKEQATQLRADEYKLTDKERDARAKNKGMLSAKDANKLSKERADLLEKMDKVEAAKPDNTAQNLGDGRRDAATPETTSNKKDDVKVLASIRKDLMADKSLSFDAKNVKIHFKDGVATLRGVVDSEDEKNRVVAAARGCAGESNVRDELEVKVK